METTKIEFLRQVLPEYQSHKRVHAAKITRIFGSEIDPDSVVLEFEGGMQHLKSREWLKARNAQVDGYYVLYADGYESWSPANVFEQGNTLVMQDVIECPDNSEPEAPPKNLTFGQALEALKAGKRIARRGWNGKGMFLWLLPAGQIPKTAIYDPALRAVIDQHVEGDTFEALPSIRMWTRNAEGRWGVLTGWSASQTDMLCEDWEIIA